MKSILTILFLFVQFSMWSVIKNDNPLADLEGTWYVNMSNFKMWIKGSKRNPKFIYTMKLKHNILGLKDVVSYDKRNKPKQLIGFDKPIDMNGKSFIWRGKGLLSLFKCKWEIIYQNESFTIIHFQKTLATAEGYDVISREKKLDPATMYSVKQKLKELGIKELTLIDQK